jgi:hypothetical protein
MMELLVEADPSVLQMADNHGFLPFERFQHCKLWVMSDLPYFQSDADEAE